MKIRGFEAKVLEQLPSTPPTARCPAIHASLQQFASSFANAQADMQVRKNLKQQACLHMWSQVRVVMGISSNPHTGHVDLTLHEPSRTRAKRRRRACARIERQLSLWCSRFRASRKPFRNDPGLPFKPLTCQLHVESGCALVR